MFYRTAAYADLSFTSMTTYIRLVQRNLSTVSGTAN
jgi:hypothetical protein